MVSTSSAGAGVRRRPQSDWSRMPLTKSGVRRRLEYERPDHGCTPRLECQHLRPAPASATISMVMSASQNPAKFCPLHDRVVIRRLHSEEKTVGGIIIPIPPRKSRWR